MSRQAQGEKEEIIRGEERDEIRRERMVGWVDGGEREEKLCRDKQGGGEGEEKEEDKKEVRGRRGGVMKKN